MKEKRSTKKNVSSKKPIRRSKSKCSTKRHTTKRISTTRSSLKSKGSVTKRPVIVMTSEEKKEKAKWQRILRVYGITKDQYDELDIGSCPVCLRAWDNVVRPCIDHDHASGHIRGLLCTFCNRYRVGRLRDADLVQRIADYLLGPFKGWVVPKKKPKKRRRNLQISKGKK